MGRLIDELLTHGYNKEVETDVLHVNKTKMKIMLQSNDELNKNFEIKERGNYFVNE